MRGFVQNLYIYLLRTAAAYAAAFSALFFATLPHQIESGHAIILPVIGNVIALGIAVAIAVPHLTPDRVTIPARRGNVVSLLLPLGLLPFLFILPSITAVRGLGFGEHLVGVNL